MTQLSPAIALPHGSATAAVTPKELCSEAFNIFQTGSILMQNGFVVKFSGCAKRTEHLM